MKFVKNTLLTFSTQIIVVILSLIISIILARTLGPANIGIYSMIMLICTLLGTFGNLGINISNTYYGIKKRYNWEEITSNSLIFAFVMGIALGTGFIAYYIYFNPVFLRGIDPKLIIIASTALPFIILIPCFQFILLGQNRIKEYNLVSIIQNSLFLALILFSILIMKGNLQEVIISWLTAFIIAGILSVHLVSTVTKIKLQFNLLLFKKSIKFGVKGYLGNIIQFFNYRIDLFLITILLNLTFVGYYSIAVSIAESLLFLPAAISTILFARTTEVSEKNSNKSTPIVCRNTIFITILAALFTLAVGKPVIVILFGSKFLPSWEPLLALLPGIISLSVCKVLSSDLTGRGKPIISTYISTISLAINIPLNLLLIPKLGITGSSIASTLSYTISAIFVLFSFVRLSKTNIKDVTILKKEDLKLYVHFLTLFKNKLKSRLTYKLKLNNKISR